MTTFLHRLIGCAPTPLANYLKALGILRIIAQQKDPEAGGYWSDQHFVLITALDEGALSSFFLNDYAPTPFVSPWNKGSGFYAISDKGLTPIETSKAPRLSAFRSGISAARAQLDEILKADANVRRIKNQTKGARGKPAAKSKIDSEYKRDLAAAEREFKRLKADLFGPFALTWRGPHREWMDAAMVLSPSGEPSWPALLGTGGNDGRLDFTNTAMQRLGNLFDLASSEGRPRPDAVPLLRTALFETPSASLVAAAVGQFSPASAGGANGTTGPDAESRVNPWDFILMMEGAVAFRGRAHRRLGAREDMRAAIPFAVAAHGIGHATAGDENSTRGEQWMPLWSRPASWPDIAALFGEGRAQMGRVSARRPLEFAQAIGRLGVARGLTGFIRYGYLERNGQSNLAVPLGRLEVCAHPRARLIDEIGPWLNRLRRESEVAPARFSTAVTLLSNAVFDAVIRDAEAARWQSVLAAIDLVQRVQAGGTAFKIGPCPRLSKGWIDAARDESSEWRLALALGSAARNYVNDRAIDPVRGHTLPIDPKKSWSYAIGADKRLLNDPRVVMTGRDSLNDLVSLVERRLVESSQRGVRSLPLVARRGFGARLDDLAKFTFGNVDVDRTVTLARALMAVEWDSISPMRSAGKTLDARTDEAWETMRLCALPYPIRDRVIPAEPAMYRRLASVDVAGALEIALRRLRATGFRPPVYSATTDPVTARRWAAAFAFPIDSGTAELMADHFENPIAKETP